MLTDTGPLVGIVDRNDKYHAACMKTSRRIRGPMQTTWPCFTEAMYLLGESDGARGQAALWRLRTTGRLILLDITLAEADRMDALMAQYANVPMDLADASLVAVAERRRITRLFAIDTDFLIYRLADGSALELAR